MIFLPNKYERLCSALRIYVHKSTLKKGILPRHIKNMRKIIIFEALGCHKNSVPTDITELCSHLLSLIYLKKLKKGENFAFSIKADGRYMLNPHLFSCLILSLSENSDNIRILKRDEKIVIMAKTPKKESLYIAKAIKGLILLERKTNEVLIVLAPTATDKEPLPCGFNIEALSDPFSAVNVFI